LCLICKQKSDQAESVVLHHDIIHNPATVFHFELQWIGTTARCIEEQLKAWNRLVERHGLKLVEAYVTQISDISSQNAFQSCFPIRLAVLPPSIPNTESHTPEYTPSKYFEYALLHKFDFIVDVEAAELYPDTVDVIYSYRRLPYKYSQFVHKTGAAFVQVIGGSEGFLFLTNRLIGRLAPKIESKKDSQPVSSADDIRERLSTFCSDADTLNAFYEEQLALLGTLPENPPPLSI